jgi:tetratricopeptide (TPR) repeat protein
MQKHTPPVITRQPRVFRKDLGVFYSGYVHETIEQSLEGRDNFYIIDNGMSSLNTGFLKEDDVIDTKLIFYGRLLEKEVADNPENAKAYLELAAHYRNIGKRDDAIDLLISALQIKYDYLMARKELAIMYMRKALDVIKQAEGQETHDEELTNNLRAMHADLNKWSGAEHMIGNPKVQRYAHDQYKAEQRKLKAA